MATSDYTRLCSVDGCAGPVQAKGMCPKHYQRQLKYGYVGDHVLSCKQCGGTFSSNSPAFYCSDKCNWTAQARKAGVRPRQIFVEENRPEHFRFTCEWCGKACFRSQSRKNQRYPNRWCSMACRKAQAEERNGAPHCKVQFIPCKGCGSLFCQRHKSIFYCAPVCKKDAKSLRERRPCAVCRAMFMPSCSGGRASIFCSFACRRKKSPAGKRAMRIAKARRRARIKSLPHESIDPIVVFERDGWQCRLCGVPTPKRLRGKQEPNAPELDHIIPLARGGGHLWSNVQCACRQCNIRKGDKPLGQLLIAA